MTLVLPGKPILVNFRNIMLIMGRIVKSKKNFPLSKLTMSPNLLLLDKQKTSPPPGMKPESIKNTNLLMTFLRVSFQLNLTGEILTESILHPIIEIKVLAALAILFLSLKLLNNVWDSNMAKTCQCCRLNFWYHATTWMKDVAEDGQCSMVYSPNKATWLPKNAHHTNIWPRVTNAQNTLTALLILRFKKPDSSVRVMETLLKRKWCKKLLGTEWLMLSSNLQQFSILTNKAFLRLKEFRNLKKRLSLSLKPEAKEMKLLMRAKETNQPLKLQRIKALKM